MNQTFLGKCITLATKLSRYAIWTAGFFTLLSALYITADVIFRKIFNTPLGSSDELSGYVFAISISWALSYATLDRANIRIDAIYQVLPTRIAAILDWIALVGLSFFIIKLTQYAIGVAGVSWKNQSTANTILGTPLWIPHSLWVLGLLWFGLVLTLMLLRSSIALVTGNINLVQQTCGIRTTKEEAILEAEVGKSLLKKGTHL